MRKWLIALISASIMGTVSAQSTVSDFFKELQTFSADFSQIVTQDNAVVQTSSGKVWLEKPLKFRWNYINPEPMQLISDGQQLHHYDIELAQVTEKPIEQIANGAFLSLLNGKNNIDQVFFVKTLALKSVKKQFPKKAQAWLSKDIVFYELKPKKKAKEGEQTALVIIGLSKSQQLTLFYAKDNYGENVFLFNNVQKNTPISNEIFQFNPPKGVDILGS